MVRWMTKEHVISSVPGFPRWQGEESRLVSDLLATIYQSSAKKGALARPH